jgi:hypothetical protein
VRSSGINARPDLWVFSFLNVYGILAWSKTQTSIDAGVWVPKNDSTSHQVTSFSTTAHFNAKTMGFGLTPTMGVGGYFFALDMNFTWTDVDKLNSPAFAFILGPRLGKNFQFKKPDMALAVWIGGFRVHLNSGTEGNIAISDIMPEKEFGAKVDEGLAGVAAGQEKVDAWWNGLSTAEQNNPLNIAKHNALNSALEKAGNFLLAADQVASNLSNTTVQYSLDKKPKDMWNFLIGAQFQINRDWMIRTELGFLGTRTQFIGGIQYRFNL